MYVMVTQTYPWTSVAKIQELYQTVVKEQHPDYETIDAYLKTDLEYGIRAYVFYKIKKGREEEGLSAIAAVQNKFTGIEGYRYTVDIVASVKEATAGQTS
jgi:translation elongation factor EF-1beta